jgi:ribosomal protein S12 methylthiotransferase accessory factor
MKIGSSIKDALSFKCDDVKNTISRIEQALQRMGLEFEYASSSVSRSVDLHWGSCSIPSLNFFVAGKGTSEDLAKASAYAELIERLSSGMAVKHDFMKRFNYDRVIPELKGYSNFDYLKGYACCHQDDAHNPLPIESLLAHRTELSGDDVERIKQSEVGRHWVDGYSLLQEKWVHVPMRLVHKISGSNGLAAGNTLEEAIVQASNEIFERHVCIDTIRSRRIIPTIDTNSIGDEQISDIVRFLKKNKIEVLFKDFSQNGLFPCVGILIRNHNLQGDKNPMKRAYRGLSFRVASSFNRKEAYLRCFNETVQGKSVDILKKEGYLDQLWNQFLRHFDPQYEPYVFLYNIFRKYDYAGDLSFLTEGTVREASHEAPLFDCLQEIERIKEICRRINKDLVIVDLTHSVLQFPVVRVIIPGISDIISYTRLQTNIALSELIAEPTKNEQDFEVSDEKYIYEYAWMNNDDDLRGLIGNLIRYVKAYNTHALRTYGLFNWTLDAIQLLACIFLKLDDMRNFDICIKALSSLYPRNMRFYKHLQLFSMTGKREKLLDALRRMEGYERFILLDEGQNPLAPHFDESLSGEAERKYVYDLKRLLGTFYSSKGNG